jgi:HEAT repeat protein
MSRPHRGLVAPLAAVILLGAALPARAESDFLGKPAARWEKELADPKPEVRRGAAFALGKCGSASAVPALVRALDDADAAVRDAAAYAIGEVAAGHKDPALWGQAGAALRKVLAGDKDAKARRSAACAVGNFGPDAAEARADLEQALGHKDALVRQNAAWALGRLKDKAGASGVEKLARALRDDDPVVRRDAAAALGEVGRPTATPALGALIECIGHEKEAGVRSVALGSLVAVVGPGDKQVAPELRGLLQDKDREVRRGAALALANVGGADAKAAVPVLLDALGDDDATARELAAAALGNAGEAAGEAVPALGKALSDRSPAVRRNAALALARVGPKAGEVVRALARALDTKEPAEVRQFAAEALGHAEDPVNEVVPQLLAVLKDDRDQLVRQRVVVALRFARDFEKGGAAKALEAVLDETGRDALLVRYDAARVLGHVMQDKAPPKAVGVLTDMLHDTRLREYKGTDPTLKKGDESVKGGTGVKENLGDDARHMAAQALAEIARGGKRKDALDALKAAAESKDATTKKAAEDALKAIGRR